MTGLEMSRASGNQIKDFKEAGILIDGPTTKARADHNKITFLHAKDPNCSLPISPTSAQTQDCAFSVQTLKPTGQIDKLGEPTVEPQDGIGITAGVAVEDGAAADVELNKIHSGLTLFSSQTKSVLGGGVLLFGADGTTRVRTNDITDSFIGIGDGGLVCLCTAPTPTVVATGGAEISYNELLTNVIGITVPSDADNVFSNVVHLGIIGIEVDGVANLIHDNDFTFNFEIDCEDGSPAGGGTAGTSNTWTNDLGNSDQPDGICTPAFMP